MKTQTCKTASVMNLLARGPEAQPVPAAPQTGISPTGTERTIETITGEILEAKRVGGEAILTIGNGLIEAKAMLTHGEWLPWLTEQVEFSERTAQNFMKLARNWSNPQALADLGATKALVLLALPPEERDSFMAGTHTVDGEEKTVIDMSARELEKALRDREQALADKTTAEKARAKMEQDMTMVKQLLETAQAERVEAVKAMERAIGDSDHAANTVAALEKEIAELKSRPVEVAVQTVVDQEAVAKARAEGEAAKAAELAALQKKLDKAKAEKDKLVVARDEAEEKRKVAEGALDETRRKLAGAVAERQNVEKALAAAKEEKPSAVSSDADLAQFKLLFEQAQTVVNQMRGLLLRLRTREDGGAAGKIEQALAALAEKVRGCAQ